MIFSKKTAQFLFSMALSLLIDKAHGQTIRLMAWNVFMLPPPIYFSKQKERTQAQIEAFLKLAEQNDILVLTEAFQKRYKREVLEDLKQDYPYQIVQKKKRGLFKFMPSGVVILSKYPIRFKDQVYYKKCAKADCMATKGALLVEVLMENGKRVQIAGTHMQSGSSPKVLRARKSQVEQVKKLLQENEEAGVPQILAGDLNIDSQRGSEFEEMRNLLGLEPLAPHMVMANTKAEKVECFGKVFSKYEKNIDHILVKKNGSSVRLSDEVVLPIRAMFKSGQECDLSDHHPVQSLIHL